MVQGSAANNDYELLEKSDILDLIRPIGSLYFSKEDTDPGTLFGGTWQKIEGYFILGSNWKYTVGSTGGAEEVTLTQNQMPRHAHEEYGVTDSFGTESSSSYYSEAQYGKAGKIEMKTGVKTDYAGNNEPHSNMPPYKVYNIWERTA